MERSQIQTIIVAITINAFLSMGLNAQESYYFSSSFEQKFGELQKSKGDTTLYPAELQPSDSDSESGFQGSSVRESLNLIPKIRTPETKRSQQSEFAVRAKTPKQVLWKSDQFMHGRLMFEEPCLERNGLVCGEKKQVSKSAAKFFLRGFIYPVAALAGLGKGCESTDQCRTRK